MRIWMVCEKLAEGCALNVTVLEIRNSLRKQGHEVVLFCPAAEAKQLGATESGVRLVPTILPSYLKHVIYQLSLLVVMGFSMLKERPDWIYTRPYLSTIAPAVTSWLMRVPHFLHLSGDPLEQLTTADSSRLLRSMYSVVERVNCRLSSRIIVETYRNKITYENRHGLPPEKVIHISNGVNTKLFKPMDTRNARQKIGMQEDCFCVGFVGNLTKREGTDLFIKAAAGLVHEVPQALLLIVGDGPERAHLREMSQCSGVSERVRFVGAVPYNEVPLYISCMDVGVVPLDKAHFEKTGISSLKLREYLACGKPVVGSDIEGVGDILREAKCGIPIAPEDTAVFVQAVVSLARDRALREAMGKNGRDFVVENLGWEVTARRLIEAYESVRRGVGGPSIRKQRLV